MTSPEAQLENALSAQLTKMSVGSRKKLYEMLVAIDIGMSSTSISYTYYDINRRIKSFSKANIETIKQWPGMNGAIPVPTSITYKTKDNVSLFGYQAEAEKHDGEFIFTFQDFKSLVHDSPETRVHNQALRKAAAAHGLTAYTLISDYVHHLVEHSMKQLSEFYDGEIFWHSNFRICFSLPPCVTWNELSRFHKACVSIGLLSNNLFFASEVECVLIGGISAGHIKKPEDGADEVVYLVVDGGKLTVDAAVLGVKSTKGRLVISEKRTSEGIISGALILTQNFRALAIQKLQSQGFDAEASEEIYNIILDTFEDFKLSFDGSQNYVLKKNQFQQIDPFNISLQISSIEMKNIVFNPVVDATQALLARQLSGLDSIDLMPEDVSLYFCGGLAANPYIAAQLCANFTALQSFSVVPYEKELVSRGLVILGATERKKEISTVTVGILTESIRDAGHEEDQPSTTKLGAPGRWVRWLVGYGQTLTNSIDEEEVSMTWPAVPKLRALSSGWIFKSTIYRTSQFQPQTRFTEVTDLPAGMETIECTWNVPAEAFNQGRFKEIDAEQIQVRVTLDVSIRVKGTSPALLFKMWFGKDLYTGIAGPGSEEIALDTSRSCTLNLLGSIGSRNWDGPLPGDKTQTRRIKYRERVAGLIEIHPEDKASDVLEQTAEEASQSPVSENLAGSSDTHGRKRGGAAKGDTDLGEQVRGEKRGKTVDGEGDVEMGYEETHEEDTTGSSEVHADQDVVMEG